MDKMSVGILIIGDEILKGQVVDCNSSFLCKELYSLGIKVGKVSIVSDSVNDIAQEVRTLSKMYTYVITTGGVGLTHDDVTYEGIAKAFNKGLVMHNEMVKYYKNYLRLDVRNSNIETNPQLRIACVPKTSEVIFIPTKDDDFFKIWGSFPIVRLLNIFIFPGIPELMKLCFKEISKLYFKNVTTKFYNRNIYINCDEVTVVPSLNDAVKKFKGSVVFGSYPVMNNPIYKTKLTMEATDEEEVIKSEDFLKSLLPTDELVDPVYVNAADEVYTLMESPTNVSDAFTVHLRTSVKVVEKALLKYSSESLFINFNGGKDCTVLLHLVTAVWQRLFKTVPNIATVYFKNSFPFEEIEEFIEDSAKRYRLNVVAVPGPIKSALSTLLIGNPKWEAGFMGTRRSDPHSEHLSHFKMTDADWPQIMRISPILDWSYSDIWKFLRTLNVPYCSLYDQGYTSIGNQNNTNRNPLLSYENSDGVTLYKPAYMLSNGEAEREGSHEVVVNKVLKLVSSLEPLLISAFGHDGLAVFIQKSNGKIMITRSGFNIINYLITNPSEKPINKLLLNYIEQINYKLGDGVKRFIFYVNSFMKLLLIDFNNYNIQHQLKQFKILQSVINLAIVNYTSCHSNNFNNTLNKHKLNLLIKNLLSTRFTSIVFNQFSELILNWILSYHSDENNDVINIKVIEMLLNNFDVLCINNHKKKSLSESKLQNGFVINGKINNSFIINNCNKNIKCIVKIFQVTDENILNDSNNFNSILQSDIIRLITEIKNMNNDIILLVTNIILDDTIIFYLKIRNIISIEGVAIDDVKFLYDYLLKNYLNNELIIDLQILNNNTIWLNIPNVTQLILSSPTNDLNIELKNSLNNFLTLINFSVNKYVCDINDKFELLLYYYLINNNNFISNRPPVFINSRDEFLRWLKIKNSINEDEFLKSNFIDQHLSNGTFDVSDDIKNLISFSKYLSDSITAQVKSYDLNEKFLQFYCDVLFCIVRIIKPKESSNLIHYHLELVNGKLNIMNFAIDFVLNVCNIDSIIQIGRKI